MSQARQGLEEGEDRGTEERGLDCTTTGGGAYHSRSWRQNKREKGREKGRKEGERLRERGQTTCTHSGGIAYVSVLECVAAGGDFDRCRTRVAQLSTEEGRTGGERSTAELLKETRLRSWVCKGGLREGHGIKKVGQTHVGPFPVFAKF